MNIKVSACIASVLTAFAALAAPLGGGGILGSAWVYIPSESVISNDNAVGKSTDYVLNVQVLDADSHTLTLGKGTQGDAFKAYGGTTLDLSETIEDESGTQWTIEEFASACLRNANAPYTTIVFPKELKSSSGQQLNINGKTLVSVTIDCPNWAGSIETYFISSANSGVINLPKITTIYHASLSIGGDVTDWNLEGIENFIDSPFNWTAQKGVLNLPSVKAMGRVANNMQYDRVLLGTRHLSLESVSDGAFKTASGANRYVYEVVLGGAKGWTIGSGAFLAMNLARVYMVGAVPTFADTSVAFGLNKAEKEMVFYVPDTEEWAEIRANAEELTVEEIDEFKAAHPDWAVPFGVVAADVFQTEYPQYIGTLDPADFGVYSSVSVGNRSSAQYGDTVSISVNGETLTSSEVPYGTEVTVTAAPKNATTVVSWEGKLPDGTTPTGNSFTYTATENAAFYAVFANPWEYDAEAGTISDGYWTIPVAIKESDAHTLMIEGSKASEVMTSDQIGELNLSGPIYTKGSVGIETEKWTLVELAYRAFHSIPAKVTSFYAPTTITTVGGQLFNGCSTITNFVFACPSLTGNFGDWGYMAGNSSPSRVVLNTPNLKSVGQYHTQKTCSFLNATFVDTDLSEWDLTNLKEVKNNGFETSKTDGGPQGDLILPNVVTVNTNAFYNWKRVESAALGTNGTLKVLGATIFANNTTALKKLDFGKSCDFTTEETTFLANDTTALPIEEVWFADKAPSTTTLDNILALKGESDTALTTDSVKVFAPLSLKSWRDITTPLTDDEESAKATLKAQGYKVIGAYVKTTGERAAWLVQNPAFKYTQGFMLIIR